MRRLTPYILGLLILASCQTPAPPQRETFDDEVVVPEEQRRPDEPKKPDEAKLDEPDPTAIPVDEPKPEPETDTPPPETFVAKPELPKNMSFQETALARTAEQVRQGLTFAPILDAGCGIPSAIRATADREGAGYTVDSCSRAVDAAHALTYRRTNTKLGVLDVSNVSIRHDGEIIWSAAEDCTALRQSDSACGSDFIARRPTVMSFVGPVLSYHMETAVAASGAKPRVDRAGIVVDVRTGRPAKIGALIDEDSLLNGLKRHSFMRRALNPGELDAAKSVDAVWKLWRTQDFAHFGGYYFAEWDAENGLAKMKIWYLEDPPDTEPTPLKELEVWVTPKPQWKAAFEEAASEQSGFLAP